MMYLRPRLVRLVLGNVDRKPANEPGWLPVLSGRPILHALLVCGLLSSLAWAGQLPHQFTLGNYIPGDVWMYTHFVHNPERDWLEAEWDEVFAKLEASGVDQDVLGLAMSLVGETDVAKWKALLQDVRWDELFGTEVAFAERVGTQPIHLDYIFLTRTSRDSAKANAKALAAILKELAASLNARLGAEGKFSVDGYERHGATVWGMCLGGLGSGPIKSIELFQKGDVVGITTREEAVEQILSLMVGKPKKRAIVDMPRFKAALSGVQMPEDRLAFFDFKRLLRNINLLVGTGLGKVESGKQGTVGKAQAIAKFIGLIDILDSLIITSETQRRRELTHTVARLQEDKRTCALACCFLDRKPFERFDEFVPVDAIGFRVDGLLNIEGLYTFITDFVEKELPGGPELIAQWNKTLARLGFDPQRDLFSWWGGEMITVTLPPTRTMSTGGKDWVWMFRVKDSGLASQKVDAALQFVSTFVQGTGQMLMISPAPVRAEGFREVTHPVLLAFARPVIGVEGDWLMVGSSAMAINKCLDVASGKAPSILENQRFRREGLMPKGPVLAASFKDTTHLGEELASASALVGMLGMGIAVKVVTEDPEAREVMEFAQRVVGIVNKLPPALQRIDFYRSESSWEVYDAQGTLRAERVVTYREPLPGEREAAATQPR